MEFSLALDAFCDDRFSAEHLDAFDAQVAKVMAAVRERWSNFDPRTAP